MADKEMIVERGMAKPFTDFEKEFLDEIYKGLGIQDWRDECIWKTARVENCAIRLAKKYQPKIPEGSVVLSKEEYEKLHNNVNDYKQRYQSSEKRYEQLVQSSYEALTKARKETAKKFVNLSDNDILVVDTQEYGEIEVVSVERLQEIARELGVEIKE